MKLSLIAILAFLLAATPIFAANLTVTSTSLAPAYANTNTSVAVLNLSLNASGGNTTVNISMINITIFGIGGNMTNITGVELRNSTDGVIAGNTTNATSTSFSIFIPGGFFVNGASANSSIKVIINVSFDAMSGLNISTNISSSLDIGVFGTDNVTTFGASLQSHGFVVQSVHARVYVTPNYVDTAVVNQDFVYTFNNSGSNGVSSLSVNLPSGYIFKNLSAVELGGSNLTLGVGYTFVNTSNQINVSYATLPSAQNVKLFFMINTSSSPVGSSAFTSFINGSNLTNVAGEESSLGSTNVTTQNILNLTTISVTKSTAILNGSDYWEFSFTFNYNATLPRGGLIQFKLSNWTENSGVNLSLNGCAGNCATLRSSSNFSTTNKFNLTNDYESSTKGITVSSTTLVTPVILFLRMVLPTSAVSSSSWQATYGILFRATP